MHGYASSPTNVRTGTRQTTSRPDSQINSVRSQQTQQPIDIPPQSLDAEKALLGSIFFQNDCFDELADVIKAEYFYLDAHRKIFEAICRLRDRAIHAFDALTVGEEVERVGALAEIGGYANLQAICEAVPHAAHARHYAETVREKALRRAAIYACTDAIRDAHGDLRSVDELVSDAEGKLHTILEQKTAQVETDMRAIMLEAFERISKQRTFGITSGLHDLDRLVNGWQPGSLIILAARPSVGKTALAIRWILSAVQHKHPCLFLSLEQTRIEVAERLLSMESEVPASAMQRHDLGEDTRDLLLQTAGTLSELPLHIDDAPGRTLPMLAARARLMRRRHSIALVVVDYLQLVESEDRRQPREQQVSEISRGLKRMARDLKVPVICLAQLNRQIEARENKRPRLSDLRESGAIEQDADVVCFIDRPKTYDDDAQDGEATLIVAKHRNGALGDVPLNWHGPTMEFRAGVGAGAYSAAMAGF